MSDADIDEIKKLHFNTYYKPFSACNTEIGLFFAGKSISH